MDALHLRHQDPSLLELRETEEKQSNPSYFSASLDLLALTHKFFQITVPSQTGTILLEVESVTVVRGNFSNGPLTFKEKSKHFPPAVRKECSSH